MKKKILAVLMACLTLTACTMAFSACDGWSIGGNGGDNGDATNNNIQVTVDQWKSEILRFKSGNELKNFALDLFGEVEVDGVKEYFENPTVYIDLENRQGYIPSYVGHDVYWELGKSFEVECDAATYTVCDYKSLNYSENGYSLRQRYRLYYEDAEKMFISSCNLAWFEKIKYNEEIIKLEDAYEVFTYNEETRTYSASLEFYNYYISGVEPCTLEHSSHGVTHFDRGIFGEYYEPCEMEIAFQQDSLTVTIKSKEYAETYNFKFYNFNKTQIVLSDEMIAALGE